MKIASSGDAEHLQRLFDLVREYRDDRQERGWAVRDDLGTIAGQLQELLKLLVSANGAWCMSICLSQLGYSSQSAYYVGSVCEDRCCNDMWIQWYYKIRVLTF